MLSRSDIIPWSFQIIFITVIFVTPGIPSASEDHVWNKVREVLPDALLKRDFYSDKFGHFPEEARLEMVKKAKEMFTFGYDSYMKFAFPMDELDPIHCKGRGPDIDNPSNLNINDVLGDYSLTLIDSLDTLAVMGNITEFQKAVKLVVDNVSFDKPYTVQVFEANIRVLGGLLAAHLLIEDERNTFGNLEPDWYTGDLLTLAHDLADRLLMAFDDETDTGIPHPRVHLQDGVPSDGKKVSNSAGAGSLILEFGMLSRLLGDPIYESYARRAIDALWKHRNTTTDLFSNDINIDTGRWVSKISGLGAGMDSFYEYLLKSYVLFEEKSDLERFLDVYKAIKHFMRRGRRHCNHGDGPHPHYVNVNIESGDTFTQWVDSLQAAIPGLQVLHGDLDEAICHHAYYYAIWKRYGCLPERYNWNLNAAEVKFYPLRPEFIESTYFLYQATKHPFYLNVGRDILHNLNNYTKAECGYATVHNVEDKTLEDRQESFFLSETCKYLYLLFDTENPLHGKNSERYLFTTEGHIFPISSKIREKVWKDDFIDENVQDWNVKDKIRYSSSALEMTSSENSKVLKNGDTLFDARFFSDNSTVGFKTRSGSQSTSNIPKCQSPGYDSPFRLPLQGKYLAQVFSQMNVDM